MEVSDAQIAALRKFVATDEGARAVLAMVHGRPTSEVISAARDFVRALESDHAPVRH